MRDSIAVCCFIILLAVRGYHQFRFDYAYSEIAKGWLKLHVMPASFREAFQMCHAEGTILASPLNENLREAMNVLHRNSKVDTCAMYTGIHATISKGAFSSIEGVPLAKIPTVWAPDEPDNFGDGEECIVMLQNGTMADARCAETYPYICYKKKTQEITLNECGTVDEEYKLDSRTGSCYKFHRIAQSWVRAFTVCTAEGGYLAIINSNTEAEVLKEMLEKNPESTINTINSLSASIGFRDWNEHTMWMTVHGQTIQEAGYAEWAPNEPNNNQYDAIGGENCGSVLRNVDPLLNDVPCNLPLAFICEMMPHSLNPRN